MKSSKTAKPKRTVTAAVAAVPVRQAHLWHYALGLFIAFCALYQVYSPSMNGPFLLDDNSLPYMLPDFSVLPLRDWISGLRPLLMLSFWLNFKQSGNEVTFGYHVVNVVLHFFNGILVYFVIRKALGWVRAERSYQEILAVFAAGLFLFHPIQTESVSYVASRSETLSLFFLLAAFVVFLYRKNASVGVGTALGILSLFIAALMSKEHTAVLPALLLLTDYYWNPGFSFEGIRRNWKLYVPIVIGGAIGVVFVFRVLSHSGNTAGFGMKDLAWYEYFFTECRAIWDYLRMFPLPFGQNLDYDFPFSHGVLDHGAIFGLIALVAVSVLAWIYRRRFPLASYGWFTYLILLAPTSSFVPIRDPIGERRLYLPFIGLLFITVEFLRRWKTRRTTMIAVLSLVLLAEAALSYQRNQVWGNAVEIWKDTVSKSPNKLRPRFQLALAHFQAQHCDEAVTEYAKAAQLETPKFDLLLDWALAYDCAGRPAEAIDKLRQAASITPNAHVYSQIGMEYGKQGKYAEAMEALATAERLNPNFEMTYVYRGNIYEVQGDKARAAQEYRHALAIDDIQYNQPARDGLARVGQ
jgi:Tfp pilus assembly protein PilF